MIFGKRIKRPEDRLEVLEARVNELTAITSNYCQEVDRLFALYQMREPAPKQTPKPRRRPRKNNGKENPKASE